MRNNKQQIILASASPRRAELLRSIGLDFEVRPVVVDEAPLPGESPQQCALRLAECKADHPDNADSDTIIIGCDTVVVCGDNILGKPTDEKYAKRMLNLLSGKTHSVITAVAMKKGKVVSDFCETKVRFEHLGKELIDWYVATGEPMDKAGAYGIQGHAAVFIPEIRGSYSNVVGLPLHLIPQLLNKLGTDFLDLVKRS